MNPSWRIPILETDTINPSYSNCEVNMSEKQSIVDKMGIAFLTEPSDRFDQPLGRVTESSSDSASIYRHSVINRSSRALASWTVLTTLNQLGANEHPVKMSQVADLTRSRADILLPIQDSLAAQGLVEVVDTTAFGDDSVKLTDYGVALTKNGEASAVARLGELDT
jgi:hypothetical protein